MGNRETTLGRFFKFFAVVAVAIAAVFCLLVGCGNGRENDRENNGNGTVSLSELFYLSSNIEDEYDLNGFVIPMSFYCNNLVYPFRNANNEYKLDRFEIIFFANKDYTEIFYSQDDFDTFDALQPGEINGSIYMIEKYPFPQKEDGFVDMETIDDTLSAYFDLRSDHKINVTLPREYLDDSGTIYFHIRYLIKVYEYPESSVIDIPHGTQGNHYPPPQFSYNIDGDKIKIEDIKNWHTIVSKDKQLEVDSKTTIVKKSKSTEREIAEIDKSEADEIELISELQVDSISYGAVGKVTWRDNIRWGDDPDAIHPANQILVEAFDRSTGKSLGSTYTDVNGNYSIYFQKSDIKNDNVYVTLTLNGQYAKIIDESKKTYTYTHDIEIPDFEATRTVINVNLKMVTDFGKALQVYQAIVAAARYAEKMNGQALLPVRVIYPNTDGNIKYSYYSPNDKTIYIAEPEMDSNTLHTYDSWDSIMHEYGHYVQFMLGFTATPFKKHSVDVNMADHFYNDYYNYYDEKNIICNEHPKPYALKDIKDNAIKLVWGEGWATYFALTAQMCFYDELKTIKTCCNEYYESNDISMGISMEDCTLFFTSFHNYGEACEGVITAFLWDLFDNDTNEAFDKINIPLKNLWDYEVNSHSKTLSEFINYLRTHGIINEDDLAMLLDHYELNAGNLTVVPKNGPTRFTWDARGGSIYYPNNRIVLKLYDASTNKELLSRWGSTTYCVLTDAEWTYLIQLECDFYCVIEASQLDDKYGGNCLTGPYRSKSVFVKHEEIGFGKNLAYNTLTTGRVGASSTTLYFFTSGGYQNNLINVTSDDVSLRVDLYTSSASLSGDGTVVQKGSNIAFIYEFLSGGTTVYIKVSSYDGSSGSFNIKIGSHSHSYSGYEQYNNSQHARVCMCGDKTYEKHNQTNVVEESSTKHRFTCDCGYSWTASHIMQTLSTGRVCKVCMYFEVKLPGMNVTSHDDR